jgi:hypothetical protein
VSGAKVDEGQGSWSFLLMREAIDFAEEEGLRVLGLTCGVTIGLNVAPFEGVLSKPWTWEAEEAECSISGRPEVLLRAQRSTKTGRTIYVEVTIGEGVRYRAACVAGRWTSKRANELPSWWELHAGAAALRGKS